MLLAAAEALFLAQLTDGKNLLLTGDIRGKNELICAKMETLL